MSLEDAGSTSEMINEIYEQEGIEGIYHGLSTGIFQVSISSFAYFYSYSFLRNFYLAQFAKENNDSMYTSLSTSKELGIGAFSGLISQLITQPISVAMTRQQTCSAKNRTGLLSTLYEILDDRGITGLWSGLKPSIILVINPSITYSIFEKLKEFVLNKQKRLNLTSLEIFFIGIISKSIATIITYPFIMAKVRLQWKSDINNRHYKNTWDVINSVYEQNGMMGLYKVL